MKKFIAMLALVFVLATATLATEIVWWYENAEPENVKVIEETLLKPFEAETGIKVKFVVNPDYDRVLRVALLSGKGPDIVLTAGPSYAQEFALAGKLLPLDEFAEKYGWKDKILPVMYEIGKVDGHLYSIPKSYEAMLLPYNKTLFEEKGWKIPETMSELEALAAEATNDGVMAFADGNAGWKPAVEQIFTTAVNHVSGPEKVYEALNGTISWTDAAFADAVNATKKWFDKGWLGGGNDYFAINFDDQNTMLATGEAAMTINGSWLFGLMPMYFSNTGMEWDWAPFASADNVDYPLYPIGIGATLSVNANSTHKDEAAQFLNFLISNPERAALLNARFPGEFNLPLIDMKAEYFPAEVDSRYARFIAALATSLNEGNFGYCTWTFFPVKTDQYIIENIDKVWLDRMTTEDFLSGMDKVFKEELSEGKVPASPKPGK